MYAFLIFPQPSRGYIHCSQHRIHGDLLFFLLKIKKKFMLQIFPQSVKLYPFLAHPTSSHSHLAKQPTSFTSSPPTFSLIALSVCEIENVKSHCRCCQNLCEDFRMTSTQRQKKRCKQNSESK